MKVNLIKFFRTINGAPNPNPKPSIRQRFEFIKKGKKLDKFM